MNISVKAHAKINLTLKVMGKRADGYHELETIMQTIALHDVLTFSAHQHQIKLSVAGMAPLGEDNLVYRAAELVREYSGCQSGVEIELVKNIPMAAGLAGGSTDAAATLLGLNKLWHLNLDFKQLLYLAEKLGADVPFCLLGGTALAKGKGERLTPLGTPAPMGVVLVKPPFGVSTADVFQRFSGAQLGNRPDTQAMIAALNKGMLADITRHLANDLEYVTLEMYPQLREIKEQLTLAGASGVLMSGSGPTIFALTGDRQRAEQVAAKLKLPETQIIVTTTG
ncbi:4-(cytidine 5'-diphospho)-2-C-methyl-D-erythritol kinase [Peptococcaceae bacterium 1198_IL3148]